jgi:hypothetical protein
MPFRIFVRRPDLSLKRDFLGGVYLSVLKHSLFGYGRKLRENLFIVWMTFNKEISLMNLNAKNSSILYIGYKLILLKRG